MKIAIILDRRPHQQVYQHIDYDYIFSDNNLIYKMMKLWISSSEREYLISMDIPFLYIGAAYDINHENDRVSAVVLDIDPKHEGIVRLVSKDVFTVYGGSEIKKFIDIRLDTVRQTFGMYSHRCPIEEMCSNQRELYIYKTSDTKYDKN